MRKMRPASGLIAGAVLAALGGFAGCGPDDKTCRHVSICGSETLSACATGTDPDVRYQSSDGHSWPCKGTWVQMEGGGGWSFGSDSCRAAAQYAADWCFSQSSATPAFKGRVIITEVMYDPNAVADDVGQWFEIYNPGSHWFDLSGCEIRNRKNAHTIAAHFNIPPGAYRTAAIFAYGGGFAPDYTYSGITFDSNAADEVSISCGSTVISRFAYTPQPANGGRALSFDPSGFGNAQGSGSNDDPQYICPATSVYNELGDTRDYGTPGRANPPCR